MSLFKEIVASFRQARRRARDREQFLAAVKEALDDGLLTDSEWERLNELQAELGLTEDDIQRLRGAIYQAAVAVVTADKLLTPEEEAMLDRLVAHFGIDEATVQRSRPDLVHYRFLYDLEEGYLPEIEVYGLVPLAGEKVHWQEPAELLEERVVDRRYQGGSSGFSFRIARGVYYRVGGHRGRVVSEKALTPVSVGEFIITNKRLIFRGDRKSTTQRWSHIIDLQVYSDGVRIGSSRRQTPIILRFLDPKSADIVGMILSKLMNELD